MRRVAAISGTSKGSFKGNPHVTQKSRTKCAKILKYNFGAATAKKFNFVIGVVFQPSHPLTEEGGGGKNSF